MHLRRTATEADAPRQAARDALNAPKRVLVLDGDPKTVDIVGLAFDPASTVTRVDLSDALFARDLEGVDLAVFNLGLAHVPDAKRDLLERFQTRCPEVRLVIGGHHLDLAIAYRYAEEVDFDRANPRTANFASALRRVAGLEEEEERTAEAPTTSPAGASRGAAPMARVLELADKIARTPRSPAFLIGESGVGKEVLAARIHGQSERRDRPFVRVNVAAINPGMLEAELFGSVRGAYTDARRDREGLLASADGGTILFDEIGELRADLQAKLLRVLEMKSFFPVGSDRERAVDVRVLAATNREPRHMLADGAFRSDLFFRLGTILHIPPLRERRDEIAPLAEEFLGTLTKELGRPRVRLTPRASEKLTSYAWPGNVRELRNAMERALLLTNGAWLEPQHLQLHDYTSGTMVAVPAHKGLSNARGEAERDEIARALAAAQGSVARAARALGVSRSTLYEKLRRYSLR